MENIINNVQNKDTEIIVTKKVKVSVPDFTEKLKDSLAKIQAAKETIAICNKEIEVEEAQAKEMIVQYCITLFAPFINDITDEIRSDLFSHRIYSNTSNTFKGNSYTVIIDYLNHSQFAITFYIDRQELAQIIIPVKASEKVEMKKYMGLSWLTDSWQEYRVLMKTGLDKMINDEVKKVVDKANQKANIVDGFKKFTP